MLQWFWHFEHVNNRTKWYHFYGHPVGGAEWPSWRTNSATPRIYFSSQQSKHNSQILLTHCLYCFRPSACLPHSRPMTARFPIYDSENSETTLCRWYNSSSAYSVWMNSGKCGPTEVWVTFILRMRNKTLVEKVSKRCQLANILNCTITPTVVMVRCTSRQSWLSRWNVHVASTTH